MGSVAVRSERQLKVQETMLASCEPLVSVVIPTFNGERFIGEAIESVLSQTYVRLEVVVIDDGSTDGTEGIVRKFEKRVRYLRQSNAGQAVARNLGVREAAGELIALLDHDDRWLPQKLERQVPLFRGESDLGMVHGGIRFFRDCDGTVTSEYFAGERVGFHELIGFEVLGVQTLVFPKNVADQVGGFDSGLGGCDDWDFCIRVAQRFALEGVAETLAEVRCHGANASVRQDKIYRTGMRLLRKHEGSHPGCSECAAQLRKARRKLKNIYYCYLNSLAKESVAAGRLVHAAGLMAQGLAYEPEALLRVPGRLWSRFVRFS